MNKLDILINAVTHSYLLDNILPFMTLIYRRYI